MQETKERLLSMDAARIFAALAIILLHTCSDFVTYFDKTSAEFAAGNILNVIARIGVPIFIMISGALMLDEDRELTFKKLVTKNIKTIALLLIFWSAAYSVLYTIIFPLIKGEGVYLLNAVRAFLEGHYHMWYLYMIIGLYLITPFLRSFVKKANSKMVLLFIALAAVGQFCVQTAGMLAYFWQPLGYLGQFISKFQLQFFFGYGAYYLAGWYIVHVGFPRKWHKYTLYAAGAVSALAYTAYARITGNHIDAYSYMNIFVFIHSAAVFCFFSSLKLRPSGRGRKALITLSNISFGVYILHPIALHVVTWLVPYTKIPALYILGVFAAVALASFGVSLCISRIPGLKKLIRA